MAVGEIRDGNAWSQQQRARRLGSEQQPSPLGSGDAVDKDVRD
jgi:hypothetical protein